jgi:alkylhydroperoxidase family enzyme
MIPARGARGPEADLWPPGRTPNVLRALSLVPDEVRGLKDLSAAHYLPMEQVIDVRAHRLLSRAQMELVAARVSALNECHY